MLAHDPTNEELSHDRRAIGAQRLGRLLIAADDNALDSFRRQRLRGAPHATLHELRQARMLLEVLARQLEEGHLEGWRRIEEALLVLTPEPSSDAEPRTQIRAYRGCPEPERLDRPAGGVEALRGLQPSRLSFVDELAPGRPSCPRSDQSITAPLAVDLAEQVRQVDRSLTWSVSEYAGLCAELRCRPDDARDIWAARGINVDGVCRAVHIAWRARLRAPDLNDKFERALERHIHQLRGGLR